ncbi:MAG: SPFH domain-containing protein [Flavobacteriales bacterium]|nr:SPFH domain-containing protein [Flavobacteriales bacterium]
MKEEKSIKPISGWIMLPLHVLYIAALIWLTLMFEQPLWLIGLIISFIGFIGFFIVNPNQSWVLVLFGNYKGTVKSNGFFWVNPFTKNHRISLRAHNFDNEPIKVNDKLGNPIMIGAVIVWRVRDTYKAAFDVNDYREFVQIQSEAALRNLAGTYPYDEFQDDDAEVEISLRGGGDEVNQKLEEALDHSLGIAGIEVLEARISHLAYANEIAGAMLQRQQATAIVAARRKIVEGAVGMVEMALDELSQKEIVHLDDEKKAAMVSNLMVVLCSDKSASPVVNTGSLYQ